MGCASSKYEENGVAVKGAVSYRLFTVLFIYLFNYGKTQIDRRPVLSYRFDD
jgi:hypothetical protein